MRYRRPPETGGCEVRAGHRLRPGQFGSLLRDAGIPKYCGLDLSENAIQMATATCKEYEFVAANVFDTDLLDRFDYDAVISLEFWNMSKRTRRATPHSTGQEFYGSVPNFPDKSHVRFSSCDEVARRYERFFGSVCRRMPSTRRAARRSSS